MNKLSFVLLLAATFTSAIQLVVHRHETRESFSALQKLAEQQNALNREWGQLLLEQSTWGTRGRIEEIARDRLDMTLPSGEGITHIRSY